MNQKNFEFLKDSLKYLGFGETLYKDLEANLAKQEPQFQLSITGEYKNGKGVENVDFKLDLKKSETSDMYFLNRYQATLKNEDPAKEQSQTFYITKNAGFTAKEAFNLLSGRAVHKELATKEGQPFKAWVQLELNEEKDKNNNFKVKQYHEGYGYELEKAVTKFPIKELGDVELKDRMMKSLIKGNITSVTFVKEGKEEAMNISANPQFKNLNVYDASMKKVFQENDKKESQQQPEKKADKKESQKQDASDEEAEPRKKNSKRKGMKV
jgi:hypothetical protein